MCRKGRDRSLESPPKPLEKQHGGGPEGPGASAMKPAGSGALGSWALGPLQRPRADTGLPSHGVPHEPWGGPWRRGCGCSGRGPVYPSRAGDAVLEDRGAGAPRAPRRLRKSGEGEEQCPTEWPRSDIRPTPGRRQSPSWTAWGHLPLGSWSSRVPDARWSQCSVELCKVAQRSWPIFFFRSTKYSDISYYIGRSVTENFHKYFC